MRAQPFACVVIAVLVVSRLFGWPAAARADDSDLDPEVPPAPTPAQSGTAVASLAGELGILDPGAGFGSRDIGGGFSLQIVGSPRRWPVMVGLGGGLLIFDSASEGGPVVASFDGDGTFSIGRSTVTRTAELRHVEAVVRLQPFWGLARPFIEGQLGLAAVWRTWRWESHDGKVLSSAEEQRTLGLLYGASIGIDWRLGPRASDPSNGVAFVVTTGVKRAYTTRMERPLFMADESSEPREQTVRSPLAMWVPFVGIALTLDSRGAADHADKKVKR